MESKSNSDSPYDLGDSLSTRNLELGVLVAAQETKDRLRPMQCKKLEFRFSHSQDF